MQKLQIIFRELLFWILDFLLISNFMCDIIYNYIYMTKSLSQIYMTLAIFFSKYVFVCGLNGKELLKCVRPAFIINAGIQDVSNELRYFFSSVDSIGGILHITLLQYVQAFHIPHA